MFKKHDLLKDRYESNCNIIVCRNVTIYFKTMHAMKSIKSSPMHWFPKFFLQGQQTIKLLRKLWIRKIDSFIYEKMA